MGNKRKRGKNSKTFDLGHWKDGIAINLDGLCRRRNGLVEMSRRSVINTQGLLYLLALGHAE